MMKTMMSVLAALALGAQVFAAEAYDEKKATGSVKGVTSFEGTPPKAKKLTTADAGCDKCRADGKMKDLVKEEFVVADGKIGNVIVYVSKGAEKFDFSGVKLPNVVLDQNGCQYSPHVIAVKTGQMLDIKSSDEGVPHNIHGVSLENGEFNFSQPKTGIHDTHPKFNNPEMGIKIKCDVHSWMNSWACAFDHTFFAVSKPDGTFDFKLPAGEYEVSVWHESTKTALPEPQKIKVEDGKATELNFTLKLK